jgi:hypothetical protein
VISLSGARAPQVPTVDSPKLIALRMPRPKAARRPRGIRARRLSSVPRWQSAGVAQFVRGRDDARRFFMISLPSVGSKKER